ncbi:MAG: hypothetical protein ACI9SE_004462, partial [Neolewinella sp.]
CIPIEVFDRLVLMRLARLAADGTASDVLDRMSENTGGMDLQRNRNVIRDCLQVLDQQCVPKSSEDV